jgi:drug/metabolite transporter (DMT)-like permease
MGALNNAIPFSLIFWGQATIGSGMASILNSTTAFFGVLVAGALLEDEPLTSRKVVGALFGVLGVAAIMGLDVLTNFNLRNIAQLAVLGAALSYPVAIGRHLGASTRVGAAVHCSSLCSLLQHSSSGRVGQPNVGNTANPTRGCRFEHHVSRRKHWARGGVRIRVYCDWTDCH